MLVTWAFGLRVGSATNAARNMAPWLAAIGLPMATLIASLRNFSRSVVWVV